MKLHYATKDLKGDIPQIELKDQDHLFDYISNVLYPEFDNTEEGELINYNDLVFLFSFRDSMDQSEIFISENIASICDFISLMVYLDGDDQAFLFECDSFEEAYKMALDMKEESKLCYMPE